jgi:adenylate cyclase
MQEDRSNSQNQQGSIPLPEKPARKKRSLKITILQTFITLMIITVAGISTNFYFRSRNAVLDLSEKITKEVTSKIIDRTTNYLNVPANQTITFSKLVTDPNIMNIHEEMWKYMWEQLMIVPQVQTFFIADTNGSYVQVRREPEYATRYIDRSKEKPIERWFYRDESYNITNTEERVPTFDPRVRPWYLGTGVEHKIYWTDVYVFTTAQTPGISASYPVLDQDGYVSVVVCANIPLHSLCDFLAEQRVTANGIVFIFNEKNEVMAYPDKSLTTRKDSATGELRLALVRELDRDFITQAFQIYESSKRDKFASVTGGRKYLVNIIPFPKSFVSQWKIFVVIPESDLLGSVNASLVWALLIALIIFATALLAIYLITNNITKSIVALAQRTAKISDFRLDEFEGVASKIREIDLMSSALVRTTQGLQAFRKYVPAALVRQLIQLNKRVELGGEKAELTIFFSDIREFTSICEGMPAEELMIHLSDYFDQLSQVIMAEKGTIDKYMGDSIMAFWGAPVKLDNSPELACRAALRCQKKLLDLNTHWKANGIPIFHTRIGIHTGETVVGNLGSSERMNYTIIGDSVNLASRLENANKLYGTHIIISESTYRYVSEKFLCRPLDIVKVKGKSESVKIYDLVADLDESIPQKAKDFCKYFKVVFDYYVNRKWGNALKVLKQLQNYFPNDASLKLFTGRCKEFQSRPEAIPVDWDGSVVLTEK